MKTYKTVLSIAGSDSIGEAGIQADIKTCCALGVYAMTAITAVTAQNTCGVACFEAVSPEMLEAQLDAVVSDVGIDAVKIGMIPDAASALVIARFLEKNKIADVVTDPVMVATSGDSLTGDGVKEILLNRIFPLSRVVTPNIPEAVALSGLDIATADDMVASARVIAKSGCGAVLLKGGHSPQAGVVTDILYASENDSVMTLRHAFVDTPNTHGTGCTLSSAVASFLAHGLSLDRAVARASGWVAEAIARGKDFEFGRGHGPLNHIFAQTELMKWK